MVEDIEIRINNLGPINEANINISKITVVGGHNGTGKSSLAKFLFSFLKANSFNRQEIAYESFLDDAVLTANGMSSRIRKIGIKDKKILAKFSASRFTRKKFKSILNLIDEWNSMVSEYYSLVDEEDISHIDMISDLTHYTHVIEENSDEFYNDLINNLLSAEFPEGDLDFTGLISSDFEKYNSLPPETIKKLFDDEIIPEDGFFAASLNYFPSETYKFDVFGGTILNDVFYIDSISLLDVFDETRFIQQEYKDHIGYLKDSLIDNSKKGMKIYDEKIYRNIIELEDDINEIVNGQFVYENGEFHFTSSKNITSTMHNTASGVKQIGIIQLLLANRELKDNCVLIIDEPEVNLHPEWQMKLAEILVLLSVKLNVSLYLNTHSPLFVEAIYTFSDYYDVADKTRYHLAEASKTNEGFIDIREVERDDLSRIYDNLGNPYLAMDVLRLEKSLE
jgi:predicted ATPase